MRCINAGIMSALALSFLMPRERHTMSGSGPLFDEDPPTPTGGGGGGGVPKLIPEDKVNEIVQERLKERDKKHLEETNKLLESKKLSETERQKLEEKKKELEDNLLDEKDKAIKAKAAADKAHADALKSAQDETTSWKNRFLETATRSNLRELADEFGAEYDQLYDLVAHKIDVVPEIVEDQATGDYLLVIPHVKEVEDGNVKKKVKVQSTLREYVELMSGEKKYDNIFKTERKSGSGAPPTRGGKGGPHRANLTPLEKIASGVKGLK